MTDDLSMKAVKFDHQAICDLSNKVDIDILLDCSNNFDKYIYFSENFNKTDRYSLFIKNKKNWIKKKSIFKDINIKDYRDIYDNILKKNGI
jgi:hypothetical protein